MSIFSNISSSDLQTDVTASMMRKRRRGSPQNSYAVLRDMLSEVYRDSAATQPNFSCGLLSPPSTRYSSVSTSGSHSSISWRDTSNSASTRTKNPLATFQCSLCPKKFTRSYNLRTHFRKHTNEQLFGCTICGKRFARRQDRKRHQALHSGTERFACVGWVWSRPGELWGCGRRFAEADGLASHFASKAGRICIKPLVEEEIDGLEYINPLVEVEIDDLEYKPAIIEHLQPSYQALVAVQDEVYCKTGLYLPAALLAQYPALQYMDWSDVRIVDSSKIELNQRCSNTTYSVYSLLGGVNAEELAEAECTEDAKNMCSSRQQNTVCDSDPEYIDLDSGYATLQSARNSVERWEGKDVYVCDSMVSSPLCLSDVEPCTQDLQPPEEVMLLASQPTFTGQILMPPDQADIAQSVQAVRKWSPPQQVEENQIIMSPTRSTRYTSASPSEQSFVGMGQVSTLSDLVLRDLGPSTLRFIEDLSTRILDACMRYQGPSSTRQQATSESSPSGSSSQQSSGPSPATSYTTIPTKRPSQPDEEDSGNNGGRKRRDTSGSSPLDNNSIQPVKLFACPYSKLDPHRYSKQNLQETRYRNCASSYHRDISRLKQHLYRVHALPKHYCIRCFQSFKIRDQCTAHARLSPPCEVRKESLYQERMTEDQYERVHRRVIKGDPYQLWYSIFEVLFPRATRPPSPYVSTADPVTLAHFVALFRAVGPETMLEFMRDRREQAGGNLDIEIPTQMVIDEAFEIAAPRFVEVAQRVNGQDTVREMQALPGELTAARQLLFQRAPAPNTNQELGHIVESPAGPSEQPLNPSFNGTTPSAQENLNVNYTQYWPNSFEFDPSEVTEGFDTYATVSNMQLSPTEPPLPTMWESLPDGNSDFGDRFGYDSPCWPH